MSWDLSLGSKQVVPDWQAEAARLRRFLDVITEKVAEQHDELLWWQSGTMAAEHWNDLGSITSNILEHRGRNEDEQRTVFEEGPAYGAVQGYLGEAKEGFVISNWGLRGRDEWQFTAQQSFYTADDGPDAGGAKPLNEYPVSWLASLTEATAGCVEASEVSITTVGIFKAIKKVRKEARGRVGAINLVPNGIRDVVLSDTITVHPCSSDTYPEGVILAVDLDKAVNNPAAVIDDLLVIHDILRDDDGNDT